MPAHPTRPSLLSRCPALERRSARALLRRSAKPPAEQRRDRRLSDERRSRHADPGHRGARRRRRSRRLHRRVRAPGRRGRRADGRRHDLPHRVDDQARDVGGGDDARPGRRHRSRRSRLGLPARRSRTTQVIENFNAADKTYTTRPAATPMTVRHLLTHTSGLGYAFSNHTLAALVGGEPGASVTSFPLLHDPGTRWTYGESTRVLGTLVEEVSGQPLDEFMSRAHLRAARHERHLLYGAGAESAPRRDRASHDARGPRRDTESGRDHGARLRRRRPALDGRRLREVHPAVPERRPRAERHAAPERSDRRAHGREPHRRRARRAAAGRASRAQRAVSARRRPRQVRARASRSRARTTTRSRARRAA